MGLLDSVTSAVNRGSASAGRAVEKTKLKTQLNDLNKRRQSLAAQLGASLYEATKDDANLRAGREALYDGIAQIDNERIQVQNQIQEIDAEGQASATAAATFNCVVCGARMSGADLFCSGCGTPIAQAAPAQVAQPQAAYSAQAVTGPVCASCGAPMTEGDMFCMSCGAKVEAAPVADDAPAAVTVEEVDVVTTEAGEPVAVEVTETTTWTSGNPRASE